MTQSNEPQDAQAVSLYAAQLHKAQQNLKQFIPKYHRLVETEKRLRHENQRLQQEIEQFNQRLVQREQDVEHLQRQMTEFLAVLQQWHQEEYRSPALHARPLIRRQFQQHASSAAGEDVSAKKTVPAQELLPLNIWLVSQNRFIEQIVGYYTRKRERLLIIKNCDLVRQLIESGFFPDMIITGAYDFGLDDPFHRSFSEFLDHILRTAPDVASVRDCFIVTLSASIPEIPQGVYHDESGRHKYISKLHGLQVTISEFRFFLELRRCQPDVMDAEFSRRIKTMDQVTQVMTTMQHHRKTGMLIVFSEETLPDIRWAFQLFYLQGKLVKTEHTLESSALISDDGKIEVREKDFIFTAFDSQYQVNAPYSLLFFPLFEEAVLREMREEPVMLR